jgi:hypothetical protein
VLLSSPGPRPQTPKLETGLIADAVKVAAYNAQSWLADRLARHYLNTNNLHDLLRSFAHLSGTLIRSGLGPTHRPDHTVDRNSAACADPASVVNAYLAARADADVAGVRASRRPRWRGRGGLTGSRLRSSNRLADLFATSTRIGDSAFITSSDGSTTTITRIGL